MITLEGSTLCFRFPEIHEHAKTEIKFQRTLRIPDDGKHYPLPPGLGGFELRHVEDFEARVPQDWSARGGIMMPLYQAEAMWIAFQQGAHRYPFAIKVAAGKINAVSGKRWKPELDGADHDYMIVPEQPWLDGFCVAKDVVRQFVAMPLGSGYSVEEQITGKAEHGGLQLVVYPMKAERYEAIRKQREEEEQRQREEQARRRASAQMYVGAAHSDSFRRACAPEMSADCDFCESYEPAIPPAPSQQSSPRLARVPARAMALAAGGRMTQQIYADPYGLDAWDQSVSSRCFVTMVDAVQWLEITGAAPSARPPTAADYSNAGLPWFDYYAADVETLAGAPALALVKSVAEMAAEKGDQVLGPDGKVDPVNVVALGPKQPQRSVAPIRAREPRRPEIGSRRTGSRFACIPGQSWLCSQAVLARRPPSEPLHGISKAGAGARCCVGSQ